MHRRATWPRNVRHEHAGPFEVHADLMVGAHRGRRRYRRRPYVATREDVAARVVAGCRRVRSSWSAPPRRNGSGRFIASALRWRRFAPARRTRAPHSSSPCAAATSVGRVASCLHALAARCSLSRFSHRPARVPTQRPSTWLDHCRAAVDAARAQSVKLDARFDKVHPDVQPAMTKEDDEILKLRVDLPTPQNAGFELVVVHYVVEKSDQKQGWSDASSHSGIAPQLSCNGTGRMGTRMSQRSAGQARR